jgi:RNA polymerase sigma factor (sigma-70 family)
MARNLKTTSTDELLALASAPAESDILAAVVAELVNRYKGVVYNQALYICRNNRALAEEVFQEAFLRLFGWLRSRQGNQILHTFPKLLSVFTKRAAIDLMRKELSQTPTGSMAQAETIPVEGPSWEAKAYVVQLMDALQPKSQAVIRLTYFDGLSAVEIGQRLGLTPENVRILRFRALALLWHFFEGSGVFGIPGTRFA